LLFDPQLVVPNEALSIKEGAVVPWAKSNPPSPYYMQVLASLGGHYGFSLETPWADLPTEVKIVVLYGTGKTPVPLTFIDGKKAYTVTKPFEGVIGNLNRRMLQTERVDEGGTGQVPDVSALRSVRGQKVEARGAVRQSGAERYFQRDPAFGGRCAGVVFDAG
jgi:excinuclease UvrABC ATPase subunit